jgi:hypothetical protein
MSTFKDVGKAFNDMAEYLEKVGEALVGSPDEAAKTLGVDLGRQLEPPTPLAKTREDAAMERDTKGLTKAKQLQDVVEKKLNELKP